MLYTQGSSTYRYGHSKEDTNIFTYKPWSWGASLDQVWPAFPHLAEQQMMVTCSMGNHPKFDKHGHWIEHVAFCSAAHHYFPYCWLSIDLSIFLFSYPFPALDSCVVSSFSFRYKRKITRERGRERERDRAKYSFLRTTKDWRCICLSQWKYNHILCPLCPHHILIRFGQQ